MAYTTQIVPFPETNLVSDFVIQTTGNLVIYQGNIGATGDWHRRFSIDFHFCGSIANVDVWNMIKGHSIE